MISIPDLIPAAWRARWQGELAAVSGSGTNDRAAEMLAQGLLWVILLGSLATPLWVPVLGASFQNVAIPVGGLAIVICLWHHRERAWLSLRPLLVASAALVAWGLAVCLLSEQPRVSLHYWVKYLAYLVAFTGFVFLSTTASLQLRAWRTCFWFLAGLGVAGVAEVLFPGSAFFQAFRSEDSLASYPRIAAVLSSPNQYGVLMVLGLAVAERLRARRRLPLWLYVPAVGLFILQIAQSGSRNAWLVLAGALAWMVVRGMMRLWRGALLAAAFLAALVLLPVPARQAGISPPALVPQASFMVREGDLRSEALCPAPVTFSLRRTLWREALAEFSRRPVQGLGIGVFERTAGYRVMRKQGYNAHSLPLGILVEAGLVGLALSAFWLVRALRAWPAASDLAELAVAILMGGQIFDLFVYDHTYTTLVVLAWASLVTRRQTP